VGQGEHSYRLVQVWIANLRG